MASFGKTACISVKLYSLREENKRWKIVAPDGELYPRYAPFFGKGQAERTVALLNQPILLAHIEELEAQLEGKEAKP